MKWYAAFEDIDAVLRPTNRGYTAWCPLFSEDPCYMLQSDFCYMIGPEMFDEFVKPELAATCRRFTNPFYHLDGVGELPHLDSLLAIEELKGAQWVPGAGAKPESEWPEVYRKIRDAGKLIQIFDWRSLDQICDRLGSCKGIALLSSAWAHEEREVMALLKRYGAE